jgi:CubicO group peptidase (beta-lactamase class C family)
MIDPTPFDAYAQRVLATGVAPAAAVAVTDSDGTRFSRTHGAADPDCLWQIGSIGKSFTAVLVLQLAEAGELDLHAPVTDYLPWFSVGGGHAPITLHHLLSHSAGLIMGAELATASEYDVIALADTDAGPPGKHFWYSNVGYRAVGTLLAAVTGRSYPELVQERILDPLGMTGTVPWIVQDMRGRLPGGYTYGFDDRPWRPEHGLVPCTWIDSAEADGCICCTIDDLAAWLRALMTSDGRLLTPQSHALLRTPVIADEVYGDHYGYGLIIGDDWWGHSGGMIGYVAQIKADPLRGIGVATVANGLTGASTLADGALALARGEQPADPPSPTAELVADDGSCPPQWAPYVGHYRSHNPWLSNFRVTPRDGGLVWSIEGFDGEREPLVALGDAAFRVGQPEWIPERLAFDSIVDGRAQRAWLSGAPYYRSFVP